MPYQPFDIVVEHPKFGSRIYAIVEVDPGNWKLPYRAVRIDKAPLTKYYRLNDDSIRVRIGTLDPAALQLKEADCESYASEDWQISQSFANWMAGQARNDLDRQRWALLARLKPGDAVAIHADSAHGPHVEHHRFVEVLPSGQKYRFTAVNANGTVYRWPLNALCLGTEPHSIAAADSRPKES